VTRNDYAEIFRSPAAVDKYAEVVYAPNSYSSHVNQRQRAYLRRLVRRRFAGRLPVQHDFACGTGRAIRLLQGLVRAAHGYDPSAAMLAKARAAGVEAHLHEVAEAGPVPAPATVDGPALVTVFRLLLNVGDDVRDRAIGFAAGVLPEAGSGLLVLENHGNRQSLRHLAARRRAGDPWFAELSHRQIRTLLARHGFTLVAARAFALCPPGAYRRGWLRRFACVVDDIGARLPWLWRWGTDVVYVARRSVQ
jgi:SAM-dependent methyltransferase